MRIPGVTLLVLLAVTQFAHGQAREIADASDLEMLPVQGNVYLLSGAGANIVVQTGPQGTLVVDSGLSGMSDKIIAAVRKLTPKPIQYILNTSADSDHAGGNDALRKAGTTYT